MRSWGFLILLTLGAAPAAGQWPGWRGPTGQGLCYAPSVPQSWSFEKGTAPKHSWKSAVPGEGNSSPIVWGERIFLTSALEDGTRLVLCFDARDGKMLWQAKGPSRARERLSGDGKAAGHASSTPATDGERVYAYFGPAGALCVDFNGRVVWHADLGNIDHVWGTAASPLLWQELVIINGDNDKESFLFALDRGSGKTRWKAKRASGGGWASPILVRAGEREELVLAGAHRLTAYDPRTGQELWHCEGLTDTVCPTPVTGHGLVFAVSGRNGPVLAIRPGGMGNVSESHLVWEHRRGGPSVPSPILVGDYLYVINDGGLLGCYEAKTGERRYVARLDGSFSASPVAAGGFLYITNEEGVTVLVPAGPQFQKRQGGTIGERCVASPALVEGAIYLRGEKHLFGIRMGEGG